MFKSISSVIQEVSLCVFLAESYNHNTIGTSIIYHAGKHAYADV